MQLLIHWWILKFKNLCWRSNLVHGQLFILKVAEVESKDSNLKMVMTGFKFFRVVMEHVCTGIQQEFLNCVEQARQLLTWKRSLKVSFQLKKKGQLGVILRLSKSVVSWETAQVFTVPKPTKEIAHWICKHCHCISARELTQRTHSELQKPPQLLSMAKLGTFQGVFEEVGKALLVVSSKESITALNESDTVDLNKKVQVLGRACDTIVVREATSDFPQVDAVLASVVKLTDNFHS